MKKIILFFFLVVITISTTHAREVRVEPSFWWSGMEETELQLMVYGENIAGYAPEVTSKNVRIKESVRLESPNYLILYIDISESTPETFDILFSNGKEEISYSYELKERNPDRYYIESFDASDVLYLTTRSRCGCHTR